jgi:hypothetical protein
MLNMWSRITAPRRNQSHWASGDKCIIGIARIVLFEYYCLNINIRTLYQVHCTHLLHRAARMQKKLYNFNPSEHLCCCTSDWCWDPLHCRRQGRVRFKVSSSFLSLSYLGILALGRAALVTECRVLECPRNELCSIVPSKVLGHFRGLSDQSRSEDGGSCGEESPLNHKQEKRSPSQDARNNPVSARSPLLP